MPTNLTIESVQRPTLRVTMPEQRMREFLAETVHELRTPLTVVRGSSETLLREKELSAEEVDTALRGIAEEARRMARLVDDLLCLSRVDVGLALDPRTIPLGPFLERFRGRSASTWPKRTISVDRAELNGTHVHVDPDALTRVLTNLVDNAARYSRADGQIRIIGAVATETVSITVRDAGPGLAPEEATRMFERFFRGRNSRSRMTRGSGLGLAIVQTLVRESRGEIGVDTGPSRGTAVTITLPRMTKITARGPLASQGAHCQYPGTGPRRTS
jgi:two-component system OmpR family sensor kinase